MTAPAPNPLADARVDALARIMRFAKHRDGLVLDGQGLSELARRGLPRGWLQAAANTLHAQGRLRIEVNKHGIVVLHRVDPGAGA